MKTTLGSKVFFELGRGKRTLEKPKVGAVRTLEEIARSGKPVKIKPHEYVEEIEERFK